MFCVRLEPEKDSLFLFLFGIWDSPNYCSAMPWEIKGDVLCSDWPGLERSRPVCHEHRRIGKHKQIETRATET